MNHSYDLHCAKIKRTPCLKLVLTSMPTNRKIERERERGIVPGRGGKGGSGCGWRARTCLSSPAKSIVSGEAQRCRNERHRTFGGFGQRETDETMGIFVGPAQSSPEPSG